MALKRINKVRFEQSIWGKAPADRASTGTQRS